MAVGSSRIGGALLATALLVGCGQDAPPPRLPLRVAVVTTKLAEYAPIISLTGEVAARVSSDLSLKVSGRVVSRTVDVGDHVTEGQVLATLDPQEQQADVTSARAGVEAADAKLRQTSAAFDRQKSLINGGYTTRREHDEAEEAFRTAQGSLEVAKAQLGIAQDQLVNTVLRAPAAGLITARSIEAGQVVQAAQTAYTLALDGPRDAVFNVYEAIFIQEPEGRDIRVSLVADPQVAATAHPREISPLLDPATGTVKVKFDIVNPPPAMTLGASLTGTGTAQSRQAVIVPWTALSSRNGKPAVWVVDPAKKTVSLRPIEVTDYEVERIVVRSGLEPGQMVVTRGQQLLHPGQLVETEEGSAP